LGDLIDVKRTNLSFGLITKSYEGKNANQFVEKNGITLDEFSKYYFKLYQKAFELNYKLRDFFVFDSFCTSKMKHSMIVYPDGNLYKCLSLVGREEYIVGNIAEKNFDIPNYFFL